VSVTDKFATQDVPKVLEALRAAHEMKAKGTVRVEFAKDGGVLSITHEPKIEYK
jgi:hypothetical protein